ncbi:LysR substrate-binding domain-containing protein [Streptomyces sp. NPDC058240]|uniref:LysR substrate-binding domain-containing protein n=1 Tax=Streptomyces sp. NPDC058240 TaxID=3346396 RepID=UPI0036E091FC
MLVPGPVRFRGAAPHRAQGADAEVQDVGPAEQLNGAEERRLRVGTFTTAGIHLLPPVLSAFRRAHPDVELTVTEYEPPQGVAAVAAGEVDLALTHEYEPAAPVARPTGVFAEPLLVEELVLITAVGQMLSEGSGRLPVTELAGRPLISSAPTHPPRRGVEQALAEAGATPAVVCESPGYALVCALVSAGIGMAVVPEMVAAMSPTPLSVRRVDPASFRRTISVVHCGDRASAAAATLQALLRSGFGRAGSAQRPGAEAG